MALGYAVGPWMLLPQDERRRRMLWLGGATTLAFVVLRGLNMYGDLTPWSVQHDALSTLFSFLNCEKYPPSLCYLLMTLGPAMVGLAWFDRKNSWITKPFVMIGRVPLFFYVL